MAESTRVGWIGTGVMGASMCGHLLDAGYPATVYNRTREKAEPLLDRGAAWAATPCRGRGGLGRRLHDRRLPGGRPGGDPRAATACSPARARRAALVDMTTSEPSLAVEIHEAAQAKGVAAIDAPVSGGDVGARNATLSIMVGGDEDAVERVRPLFEAMGKTIVHQGGPGAGQHTKMVNQILIADGHDRRLRGAALRLQGRARPRDGARVAWPAAPPARWSLSNYGPRMLAGNFDPGFFVEHFIKDMGIALAEAKRMNLSLPGLALARAALRRARSPRARAARARTPCCSRSRASRTSTGRAASEA